MEAVIASAVLSPVVKQISGLVSSYAKNKFDLLLGIEEYIQDLSSQLSAIQAVLEDAQEKQLNSPPIRDWLGKLEEALYDAEDILEAFHTEALLWQQQRQAAAAPSRYFHKLNAAQEIKNVLSRLDKIGKEKQNFQLNHVIYVDNRGSSSPDDLHEHRRTGFIVHESDVVGRDDDRLKVIDLLMSNITTDQISDREEDDNNYLSVLPIIGMGGLGKTTLAQLIYSDERVTSHFKVRMWVCVTDVFNYSKILKDIIEHYTEFKINNINSLSVVQLESRVREFLLGKPFLLVLDDVWPENFEWSNLQRLLKHGGKGCKVLVTSRNKTVSNLMGTLPPYFLDQLLEPQCRALFEKLAFDRPGGERSKVIEKIGREIVTKCNGLPLAIRVMGTLLRGNQDERKWTNILKHEIWEVEQHNDTRKPQVLPALSLSYNHLPAHLKRCFAYCCIYPKAYVFHKIDLIKVWKAASLILPRGQYTLDDIGLDYFDELLSRSFFQLSKVDNQETFRMHDLHNDLAVSVSGPYCYRIQQNDPCNFSPKARHISLLCDAVQGPVMEVLEKSKKLRTLLSPSDSLKNFGPALEKIFCTLKCIRILDLSSSVLQELPESVGDLMLLHYLDLSKTEIRFLPESICNLVNLETLRLLGCCWLFELPTNIGRLINLQHLELDDMFWNKLRGLPPRIGTITGLQNLHAFIVSQDAGHGISELQGMVHLKGSLHIKQLESAMNAGEANLKDKEGLKSITLEWSSNRDGCPNDEAAAYDRILEDLQPHPALETIQIIRYQGNEFPSWMRDGLIKSLVSVSLNHCINCRVLSLAQLPHLLTLRLKGNLELEEWIDADYHFLQRLKISHCPNLKSMPQSFLNLGVMKLKKCNSLKALPLIPSVKFLILIDNLVLENFNERIVGLVDNQRQLVQAPSFIELLELKVINCPKLPSLPKIFAPQKLEISGCQLIATLPTPQFSARFQHLAIGGCNDATLVRGISTTNSLYSLVISNISNLTSFPKWPRLPGLKTLYISGCHELASFSENEAPTESASTSTSAPASAFEGMSSLELLSIRDCPNLKTFPQVLPLTLRCLIVSSNSSLRFLGPNDVFKNLGSLKDLYIENCPEIQSLPEEGFSASLQHLRIEGCPVLSRHCQNDFGIYWPIIQHIPDLEIETVADEAPLPHNQHSSTPSAPWFHSFICCKAGTSTNQDQQ